MLYFSSFSCSKQKNTTILHNSAYRYTLQLIIKRKSSLKYLDFNAVINNLP